MTEQEIDDEWYRDGLAKAAHACANQPGFLAQWNRLTGYALTPEPSPGSEAAQAFLRFVDEHIWSHTVKAMARAIDAESN
jgi:hypothetical protein